MKILKTGDVECFLVFNCQVFCWVDGRINFFKRICHLWTLCLNFCAPYSSFCQSVKCPQATYFCVYFVYLFLYVWLFFLYIYYFKWWIKTDINYKGVTIREYDVPPWVDAMSTVHGHEHRLSLIPHTKTINVAFHGRRYHAHGEYTSKLHRALRYTGLAVIHAQRVVAYLHTYCWLLDCQTDTSKTV